MLDEALLFSRAPIRAAGCLCTISAWSKCCSTIIVGGGVIGIWSSNSNECASLLVAIPESSSRPNRKWWLWTVESVLSLFTWWLLCVFATALTTWVRLFNIKSILPQTPGAQMICWSFHSLFILPTALRQQRQHQHLIHNQYQKHFYVCLSTFTIDFHQLVASSMTDEKQNSSHKSFIVRGWRNFFSSTFEFRIQS